MTTRSQKIRNFANNYAAQAERKSVAVHKRNEPAPQGKNLTPVSNMPVTNSMLSERQWIMDHGY